MEEQNNTIDMLPFYAEALTYKPTVYKQIDKIYETNRYKYYQAYQTKYPKNSALATDKTLIQDIYFRKAAGILCYLEYNKDEENLSLLNDQIVLLFKKCYKNVFNFVNKDDFKKFDCHEFLTWLRQKADYLDNTEVTCWISAGIFFSQLCDSSDFNDEELFKTLKVREMYYSDPRFGNLALAEPQTVKQFIVNHKDMPTKKEFDEYLKNAIKDPGLELLFNSEASSSETSMPINVSEKDRFDLYISCQQNKISDAQTFYTYSLVIKGLLKQYQQVKELYKNDCEDTAWCEAYRLQNELSKVKIKLETAEFKAKSIDEALKEKINKILAENISLQKKAIKLQMEIDKKEQNEKELYALREYAYAQRTDIKEEEETKVNLDKLNTIRGVVVGGHTNWLNKLKIQLPDWSYINDVSVDDNLIKNADLLIINVDIMSHALYKKVQSVFIKNNVKIGYVSSTNIHRALAEIYAIAFS